MPVETVVLSFRTFLRGIEPECLLLKLREKFPQLVLQLVSFEKEPNARVMELIASQTVEALESKSLLATKPEVDLVLRLAGTSQIVTALKRVGYGSRGSKILVAIGNRRSASRFQKYAKSQSRKLRPLKKSRLDNEDLERVELAALLGAQKR